MTNNMTNMDRIHNCVVPAALSIVLYDMIQELCEDGMPTQDEIERWLNHSDEVPSVIQEDTYHLENYDSLKPGDTVFYLVDEQVLKGEVFSIKRKADRIKQIHIDSPDDFFGCDGCELGKSIFIDRNLAYKAANI